MSADHGRSAVYAAELAAFDGTSFEAVTTLDQLVALGRLVTSTAWWPHGSIEVVRARADATSSSARQRGDRSPVVRLAAPQMTAATVLHELAHVLAGLAEGHGPVFRRAHVDLAGFTFGEVPATWLVDAYHDMGLELGVRRWTAPPIRRVTRGPLAL